ncbi:MAG TPA: hypothetical protein VD837_14965 [Terriglobales bacterium]|nr:hypothetical protein [Terriglobales bacterium]
MKVGTENKKKTAIAVGLLVIALVLVARTLFTSPATPSQRSGATANRPAAQKQAAATDSGPQRRPTTDRNRYLSAALTPTLDPRLRFDLLKMSEDVKYEGTGRNIFSAESAPEIPEPVDNPRRDEEVASVPQGPPPPPPINLKFFGYATRSGEPRSIFLTQGDSVFSAREGDIVAGRYRIVKINPTSVEIQDVLSNNTQTIPLIQG